MFKTSNNTNICTLNEENFQLKMEKFDTTVITAV